MYYMINHVVVMPKLNIYCTSAVVVHKLKVTAKSKNSKHRERKSLIHRKLRNG